MKNNNAGYQRALKRIKEAKTSQAIELDLANLDLKSLPTEIANLSNLKTLYLNRNQLKALPAELGKLINLQSLNLEYNQLGSLSPEIGKLTGLQLLDLDGNQLDSLPPEIGKLTNLVTLHLHNNQLDSLPPEITKLNSLETLYLYNNRFNYLPPEIGKLNKLKKLGLNKNQLNSVSPEIGKLKNLVELSFDKNRLGSLPPEIENLINLKTLDLKDNQLDALPRELENLPELTSLELAGNPIFDRLPVHIQDASTREILDYLSELKQGDTKQQWLSKLVVVGEGGAGKSCTLRALRGEQFQVLDTTHGMELGTLELQHPDQPDVKLELNTWDFAGQMINHSTHQFFLTEGSLFLLMWNSRQGYGVSKLNYWLETIRALAKDAPIIIVATHTDQRDPDLPLQELQKEFSQIKGHFAISNNTGEGVKELRDAIASHSVNLPMMGETWPQKWLSAADAIRDWGEKQNTCERKEFLKKLHEHGLEGSEAETLTKWMHQLGDILYFKDDQFPELDKTLILNAEWLSKCISQVMASEEVIKGLGIFTRTTMEKVWASEDSDIRDHLLSMMEKFDLSYKTLDDQNISLVVDRLNWEPPSYESRWDKLKDASSVSMRFELATIPAGVPTWFIARSHRFTTQLHWRTGALFTDTIEKDTHLALLQTNIENKEISLIVRGLKPENFLSKLREGLELTLDRFQGLEVQRFVPCPGHGNEKKCSYEFNYEHLLKALEKKRDKVECQEELVPVPLGKLLYGLHVSSVEQMLIDIDKDQKKLLAGQKSLSAGQQELLELTQRQFLSIYNREKDRDLGKCPYVFTLTPENSANWKKKLMGEKMTLHLYCQTPNCWHPVENGGKYPIDVSADWLDKMAPYVGSLTKMMKTYLPLAIAIGNTALGIPGPQIKIMQTALKVLPDIEETARYHLKNITEASDSEVTQFQGASLRPLREFLHQVDKEKHWGELRLHTTPEGHYYWLCPKHYEAMTKPHAGKP